MKHHAILDRFKERNNQTIGELRLFEDNEFIFSCFSLELGWHDNKRMISRIPPGMYKVKQYSSKKYLNVYEIKNVKDRSKILIHWGNYGKDTNGCILLGESITDINGDGVKDLTNSKRTIFNLKYAIDYNEFSLLVL